MARIYLFVAQLSKQAWAYSAKRAVGFTDYLPLAMTIILLLASLAVPSVSTGTSPFDAAWIALGPICALATGQMLLSQSAKSLRRRTATQFSSYR